MTIWEQNKIDICLFVWKELDEAARRRLVRRLYIPLPDARARKRIVLNLLTKEQNYKLNENDFEEICQFTEGYSGSDMDYLCKVFALEHCF